MASLREDALDYHAKGRPGKIQVVPTKHHRTQRDLSLAYSPGVAEPCLEIHKDPEDAYKYTAKGNLVGVISNGTAVLGLGDIGAIAGKPVMEGKGLLFKIFSDIDVFDIEVDETDIDAFVKTVKAIAPTFGGINLEDIKAPECFEIERRLKAELDIPVMHDDQHGTAIISGAGLLNALEINGKDIKDIRLFVSGAGAAACACTRMYIQLGVDRKNIVMSDVNGILTKNRTDLSIVNEEFAIDSNITTMEEGIKNTDVFLGLSAGNILKPHMLESMAKDPIVFAMANPTPEISYDEAVATRADIIMATGRSDYPNQINNVLGFPYIFRGALDVRASAINEEMKMAAVRAIAELAKEAVPDLVRKAYNKENMSFGREYIVPTPLDPRLIERVPAAIAKAAIDSGVARLNITDWDKYNEGLLERMGIDHAIMRGMTSKAKANPKRIVFSDANNKNILQAARILKDEGIAFPVLVGMKSRINNTATENNIDISDLKIIDNNADDAKEQRAKYAKLFFDKRGRSGVSKLSADRLMGDKNYFGAAMVEAGDVDAMISGISSPYADVIRPALKIVGKRDDVNKIAGMYLLRTKKGHYFFADTSININPTAEELVDITLLTKEKVEAFGVKPTMAMLSYSNYGSAAGVSSNKVKKAISILHEKHPDVIIDGEMQANFALNKELRKGRCPNSKLEDKDVNTLIFPDLTSGNITYKTMQEIGSSEAIGPIVMGLKKPIHVLQLSSSVREIIDMSTIAVVDAQEVEE
ncbi:MAG: NADP-dependent malic enzyme [Flavobacteriales bacterium]|nr:NADP-dependent malic enzyme [Flavobacteriales bacterium]